MPQLTAAEEAAATLDYLRTGDDGRLIEQLSPRQIRILADESETEGFEPMIVAIVRRLACLAAEDVEITTDVFTAVASAELEC